MDHPDRKLASPSPRNGKLRPILLAVLAAALAGYLFWLHRTDRIAKPPTYPDFTAFMDSARQAEAIADPLQRCLRYPDPPHVHWDPSTTAAYCRLRTRRTLQIADIDALLQQGKAAEVDRIFQGYLDDQLHDPQQPGVLDEAFHNARFDEADPNTRKVIDTWIRQEPDSAFALAASGMQYADAAHLARGTGWARDLSRQQVDGMHQQVALARRDLDRAVQLFPSMTPAYLAMIRAGAMEGDGPYIYGAASNALTADPSNFMIHVLMMDKAQPKWGSEFGGEREQVREDAALVGRNPLLRLVIGQAWVDWLTCDCNPKHDDLHQLLPTADRGLAYGDLKTLAGIAYDDDPRLSIEFYSEALRFAPGDAESLRWRAEMLAAIGDTDGALESVRQAARRFPQDNAIGDVLGLFYERLGRTGDAETAFLAVLQRDPDNQQAMADLGDLYNHAGHRPDKAEALADTLIGRHPDNPAGYIIRACNQMDHGLPGRYDTIHYFIQHFGDRDDFKPQVAEMRAYLIKHPEPAAPLPTPPQPKA